MNTNDTLLIRMIEQDMKTKGVSNFQLFDNVVVQPKMIKVKANEVVYIYLVGVQAAKSFEINIVSGTGVVNYSDKSTNVNFESSLITSHWSNAKIGVGKSRIDNYFIRYVRVVFKPN